jgi:hypothetical protein
MKSRIGVTFKVVGRLLLTCRLTVHVPIVKTAQKHSADEPKIMRHLWEESDVNEVLKRNTANRERRRLV